MILRDPVHGLVSFETEEQRIVVELLAAREVQRLRRIRQLGLASLAYPGADHTRFSHAVGAAHVMVRFIDRLRAIHGDLPFWQRLTTERARDGLAAALLHDLGHGPFSHLFEEAIPTSPRHETWTTRVVLDSGTDVHRILSKFDPQLPERVAALVQGRHELTYLARTVSGTFDVDRCDYLLRDAHFTGVSYGRFDLDWLLRSLRLSSLSGAGSTERAAGAEGGAGSGATATGRGAVRDRDVAPSLAVDGAKGLPAIESFVLARLFMFQQVYFHKASRASEMLVAKILERVRLLLLDGTFVPGVPPAVSRLAQGEECSLGEYLELDDAIMWSSLNDWRRARDPVLSDLASRLYARRLFKGFDLYGDHATDQGRAHCLAFARDVARDNGFDPDVYVGLDAPSLVAFDDEHDPLTVIFPDGTERKPGDVSFLLGRLRGQTLLRSRLLFPEELRAPILAGLTGTRSSASLAEDPP
jgi:HD superfamily phosphohydrolase